MQMVHHPEKRIGSHNETYKTNGKETGVDHMEKAEEILDEATTGVDTSHPKPKHMT
jgi:hypothetical protein